MDKIEKIKKFVKEEADRWQDSYCDSMRDNLFAFLDTLESEEPEGLEKEKGMIEAGLELIAAYGLVPYMDGNAWCYLLGDNIQEGVCGFGNTRTEALIEFVKDFTSQAGTSLPSKSEEKEVDLNKEYKDYVENDPVYSKLVNRIVGLSIARHFAEWGEKNAHKAIMKKADEVKIEPAAGFDLGNVNVYHEGRLVGHYVEPKEEKKFFEELEEAAEEYRRESCNAALKPNVDGPTPEYGGSIKDAFIAGVKWREKQIPKLPDSLDEAAREYAKIPGKAQHEWYDGGKLEGFKAGAAWRDAQIPKLPDDVDEAMDIIPRKLLIENKESYTFDSTGMRFPKDCFKAGARWMANKGVTFEDSIYPTTDNEGNITGYCIDGDDEFDAVERGVKSGLFEIGDKVLVQIRKKIWK